MSQADGNIANQTFPATRTDLNNQLAAIFTNHSGATAPSTTFENQWWADTANSLLKQRNQADTSWITIGHLDKNGLIRTNAGNPNGSVTGNYEGEMLFDTTNNIMWYYSGSSTIWYNSFGQISTTSQLPTNYHDVRIEYTSASTITIKAGSRCRSADDTVDVVFTSDYLIDITDTTPDYTQGGSTVGESVSTFYYVLVGLDSSRRPLAWLDSANLEGGGTPTNPAAYSVGRRQLKIAVRNDASSNILAFNYYDNREIIYVEPIAVLSGGTQTSFTAVSCSSCIPPLSTKGIFTGDFHRNNTASSQGYANTRKTGTSGSGTIRCHVYTNTYIANQHDTNQFRELLNTSQQFDYITSGVGTGSGLDVHVNGYEVTEVK